MANDFSNVPSLIKKISEVLPQCGSRELFTPDEFSRVAKIEELRRQLLTSEEAFAFHDYGARRPDAQLTEEEMMRGEIKELRIADLCRRASKSPARAALLFRLVRTLRPMRCLELGTCLGISAAYLATGLQFNHHGTLVTIEGDKYLAQRAQKHLSLLGLSAARCVSGSFLEVLPEILEQYHPLDFVFVDGHHDGKATLKYWNILKPALARQSVIIFDDIHWSASMEKAWKDISCDSVAAQAVDLGDMGQIIVEDPLPGELMRSSILGSLPAD